MESNDVEQDVQPELTTQSVGAMLKEARIRAGLSLEQVADKINLRAHNIESLEKDEVDPNVSLTFTRGYIKLYARLVGLDETNTIAIFDKTIQSTQKETARLQSFSKKVAKEANDQKLMAVTWIIVAVIVGLFVVWAVQQTGWNLPLISEQTSLENEVPVNDVEDDTKSVEATQTRENVDNAVGGSTVTSSEAPPVVVGQDTEQAEELNPTEEQPDNSENGVTSFEAAVSENDEVSVDERLTTISNSTDGNRNELVANDELLSQDVPSSEGVIAEAELFLNDEELLQQDEQDLIEQAPGVITNADLVQIVFEFSADCWVNISDATGEDIAFGVKQEGKVMTLEGVPPIEVVLGAPSAVAITYDGEIIDMTQFPASRTARFELPILN